MVYCTVIKILVSFLYHNVLHIPSLYTTSYNSLILLQGFKVFILTFLLIGVVPLLIGLLFEQILVLPLRVPLDQSPVFFPWQVSDILDI